ncbi:ADP-ribose glycohydrolase OARD1-like [Diadema antillarum]|uniref:ADP-ribose glycohydrolase OARD1-like n=1 Tax=Diadema antillarum TaxID=105358 RepID=UPI003A850A98
MEKFLVKNPGSSSKKVKTASRDSDTSDGKISASGSGDELDHSKSEGKAPGPQFQLKEVKGDLFAGPPSDSLAHCISADVRMGKGIATIFKDKFGGVKELLSQGVKPGGVAVLKRGSRYIYYMVTKEKYWQKPTYDTVRKSLQATMEHCRQHGVRALSMPRIACGLDGLKWDRVRQIICEIFTDSNVSVTIFTL